MIQIAIPHEGEVLEVIGRAVAELGIRDAAITSIIGMVSECAVSAMSKDDHTNDIVQTYHEPLELSGVGEVRDGVVHVHVVLGAQGNVAISGHLVWARAGRSPTNAYVSALS